MINLLVFLSFIFLPLQQEKVLNHPSDFISSDVLGNLFCINDAVISKFNSDGDFLAEYSNSYLGKISQVDASDPFRILLFYNDFNQALFLNKDMSEIGDPIDLYNFASNETTLICSSQQGGFWIFNTDDMQAVRISPQGKPTTKSILLNDFFDEQQPSALIEKNENLYFLIPNKGILVLTDQGQFHKILNIKGIESFQIKKESIFYAKNKIFYRFVPMAKVDPELFPEKNFLGSKFRIEENVFFNSNDNNIFIYSTR